MVIKYQANAKSLTILKNGIEMAKINHDNISVNIITDAISYIISDDGTESTGISSGVSYIDEDGIVVSLCVKRNNTTICKLYPSKEISANKEKFLKWLDKNVIIDGDSSGVAIKCTHSHKYYIVFNLK